MQTAYVESFNGRMRDELFDETLFLSQHHARVVIAAVVLGCWRKPGGHIIIQRIGWIVFNRPALGLRAIATK